MPNPSVRISTDTPGREHSADLWRGVLEKYAADPEWGYYYEDDCQLVRAAAAVAGAVLPDSQWWFAAGAAGGTGTVASVAGSPEGLLRVAATTGTDHFGFELHKGLTATTLGRIVLPTHGVNPQGTVVTEARIDGTLTGTFFIGLAEAIANVLSATGTLPTDSDYIGIYRLNGGDVQLVAANDNAGGTAVLDAVTIMTDADFSALVTAGDPIKFGIRVNADNKVEVSINGSRIRANTSGEPLEINALALPIESLTERVAVLRGADTDEATLTVDVDYFDTYVSI
jgi:hypothetical protein